MTSSPTHLNTQIPLSLQASSYATILVWLSGGHPPNVTAVAISPTTMPIPSALWRPKWARNAPIPAGVEILTGWVCKYKFDTNARQKAVLDRKEQHQSCYIAATLTSGIKRIILYLSPVRARTKKIAPSIITAVTAAWYDTIPWNKNTVELVF